MTDGGSLTPPHSNEAETAVLGALLFDYSASIFEEAEFLLSAEDFYAPAHQRIYKGILELHRKGAQVDILTLTDELKKSGDLETVGGVAKIADLTSVVPTAANLSYYADIVHRQAIRRRLLTLSQQIRIGAFEETSDIEEIIEVSEKELLQLADDRPRSSEFLKAGAVLSETVDLINLRSKNKNAYTGIPSGFSDLDIKTLGFQDSEMILIGARPSVGKTAFALSLASNIAIHQKIPCGFFTLEMTGLSLMQRILSAEARVDANKLRSGLLGKEDWAHISDAAEEIYESPLYIDDTPSIKLMDLRSRGRRMVRKHDVKIIFVDYLGLISIVDKSIPRHEQVAEISMSLKALARELNIPVVALSQVGRQTEGKAPGMADLRGSGALEQDADMVLYLHRDRNINDDEQPKEQIETELLIAKQRNGPVGVVKLQFHPQYTRFDSAAPY